MVEALQDGLCAFELWIRHPVADLRLSEKSLPLQGPVELGRLDLGVGLTPSDPVELVLALPFTLPLPRPKS